MLPGATTLTVSYLLRWPPTRRNHISKKVDIGMSLDRLRGLFAGHMCDWALLWRRWSLGQEGGWNNRRARARSEMDCSPEAYSEFAAHPTVHVSEDWCWSSCPWISQLVMNLIWRRVFVKAQCLLLMTGYRNPLIWDHECLSLMLIGSTMAVIAQRNVAGKD